MSGDWTGTGHLPGGDLGAPSFAAFLADLARRYPWLPAPLAHHYGRLYGSMSHGLLAGAHSVGNLGRHFGGLLYEREIGYLREAEWAQTAEDILERRTKHGLHLSPGETEAVRIYLKGWTNG